MRSPLGFLAFLLPLVLGTGASARTWHVEPGGTGDAPTIQAAVDSAGPGDEVLLANGTFLGVGNVEVDYLGKAITIRSASGDAAACVIDCEFVDSGFLFRTGEGPSSILGDLTLAHSPHDRAAIDLISASPTIRRVTLRDGRLGISAVGGAPLITGCLYEGNIASASASQGVSLYGSAGTVEHCTFRSNTCQYVVVAWGGDTTVRACDFIDNAASPIWIHPMSGLPVPNATIEDCTFDDNAIHVNMSGGSASTYLVRGCEFRGSRIDQSAVGVSGSPTVTIEDCLIEQNGFGVDFGSLTSSSLALIRDCEIRDNNASGIKASGRSTIERCAVRGNGAEGIDFRYSTGATVRDCLITGNGRHGVAAFNCASVTIEECTVASNHAAFSGGGLNAYSSTVDVSRSIFWGNCAGDGYEMWLTQGSIVSVICVNVDTSLLKAFGAGSFVLTDVLEDDPLFCSPLDCAAGPGTGGVYGLDPASPALSQPCGPMGAPGPTCVAVGAGAALEVESWGAIKARYRQSGEASTGLDRRR